MDVMDTRQAIMSEPSAIIRVRSLPEPTSNNTDEIGRQVAKLKFHLLRSSR